MSFASRHLRLIGPLAAAAALTLGSIPASAQTAATSTGTGACTGIRFELANPGPGARVDGNLVVQGIAQDTRATTAQGLGIDRVDFFLGSRDQGGTSIGSAVPGAITGPFGTNSFQTTLVFPKQKGGHDLVAYAHSVVTGQEEVISQPITIGEDPADSTTTPTQTVTCMGNASTANAGTTLPATTPATAPAPAPAAPAATTPAATTTKTAGSSSTIVVNIGNPQPGDTIKTGAIAISGDARDTAATSGSGIDRIDIFLDDRDAGGRFLGSAQLGPNSFWQATVTLPNNQTGLHELFFYAHSSASGATKVVSVPVTTER
jgi:hypothetical protein